MDNNLNTNSFNKPIFPPLNRLTNEDSVVQTIHKNLIDTPIHFETDYISMKWIPEKRRIDVIWKQFVSEEKVREVLLKEVAMIRHTKVKCLFLDAQKFKGTNPNIPRWANEVWSQMVHDAGLKHFATVVSDKDIFAVFSLKYGMGEKLTSLVNCAVFKTIEEGEVWLRQYTHPESPVYSENELEQIMEEYENLTVDSKTDRITETKIDEIEEVVEPVFTTEIEKEEVMENEILKPILKLSTEKELQLFDLKNELQNDFEEKIDKIDEQDDKRISQIQVFSNFEDLENHIQTIESQYEIKDNNLDKSEK
jgi:hypothetical protein